MIEDYAWMLMFATPKEEKQFRQHETKLAIRQYLGEKKKILVQQTIIAAIKRKILRRIT